MVVDWDRYVDWVKQRVFGRGEQDEE